MAFVNNRHLNNKIYRVLKNHIDVIIMEATNTILHGRSFVIEMEGGRRDFESTILSFKCRKLEIAPPGEQALTVAVHIHFSRYFEYTAAWRSFEKKKELLLMLSKFRLFVFVFVTKVR